jgi:hypothetical protein
LSAAVSTGVARRRLGLVVQRSDVTKGTANSVLLSPSVKYLGLTIMLEVMKSSEQASKCSMGVPKIMS